MSPVVSSASAWMLVPLAGVAKSLETVRFMSSKPFDANVRASGWPPAAADMLWTMTTCVASVPAPYSVTGVEPE